MAHSSADPYLALSMVASDYVAHRIQIDPACRDLFCHDLLHCSIDIKAIEDIASTLFDARILACTRLPLIQAVTQEGSCLSSKDTVMQNLRQLRHQVMLRIIGRMACGIADCPTTLTEISTFADWCVRFATRYAERFYAHRHGIPCGPDNEHMEMLVIGMGKLGGDELNLSSDIDLIFVQPDTGDTRAAHQIDASVEQHEVQPIDSARFFTRIGKLIIELLAKVTSDGFVFRTDMRLRPYGDSGALVSRLSELESYYHEQARSWERFALCRAKVLTGSPKRVAQLEHMIGGFVYRRYVDFDIINQLRQLHNTIAATSQRVQGDNNIKIGVGGIREIEFHAQALQLIHGGHLNQLQQRNTLHVLAQASAEGVITRELCEQLSGHYVWLRDIENRLQALNDEQTQTLPTAPEKLARIAAGLGFVEIEEFLQRLQTVRAEVHEAYTTLLRQGSDRGQRPSKIQAQWLTMSSALLAGDCTPLFERLDATIEDAHSASVCSIIQEMSTKASSLDEHTLGHLHEILPSMLRACFGTPEPKSILTTVFELLCTIVRRPVYLSLLRENHHIIAPLIFALATSRWCAQQIIAYPMLLSCFLESQKAWQKPDRADISSKLQLQLFSVPDNDLEQSMDALRHFAQGRRMQVALAQLNQSLSLMQISDYLSFTADACIEAACRIAWKQLAEKHGAPGEDDLSGVVVWAYGKLGGLELSYTSDLDLVFIYDQPNDTQGLSLTKGPKRITILQFYQRFAQRVIHLLSAPTTAGFAYTIDTRLRPNGDKGLLASSLDSWKRYYRTKAWTWELQALIRARAVCGSQRAIASCNQARIEILATKRDATHIRSEIVAMRQRMLDNHGNKGLKHMRGGIIDIEFIIQYLTLIHCEECPSIATHSDNIRIVHALAQQQLIEPHEAKLLREAYLTIRNILHAEYLEIAQHTLDIPNFPQVNALWNKLLSDASTTVKSSPESE